MKCEYLDSLVPVIVRQPEGHIRAAGIDDHDARQIKIQILPAVYVALEVRKGLKKGLGGVFRIHRQTQMGSPVASHSTGTSA